MFDANPYETHGMSTVAKAPKRPGGKSTGKQFGVRIHNAEDVRRIEETARALGLDETNFLRMMILEMLPKYERKAAQLREGHTPTDE